MSASAFQAACQGPPPTSTAALLLLTSSEGSASCPFHTLTRTCKLSCSAHLVLDLACSGFLCLIGGGNPGSLQHMGSVLPVSSWKTRRYKVPAGGCC